MSRTTKYELKVIIYGAIVVATAILALKVSLPYIIEITFSSWWRTRYNMQIIEGLMFIFGSLWIVFMSIKGFLRFLGGPQIGHLKAELLDAEEALESAIDAEEVAEASKKVSSLEERLKEFEGE